MRAMVTGAAGFVGSHLCDRLLEDGHDVLAVDKFSDYYDPTQKRENVAHLLDDGRFNLLEADVASEPVLRVINNVDVIFHLAGQPGVRPSWDDFGPYLRENVQCVQTVLEAVAQSTRPPRIVLTSSSSVYGDADRYPCAETSEPRPMSPYGTSKLSMEHLAGAYVRTQGLPVVILRYFTVYGPRQRPDMAFHRFIDAALTGGEITVYGDGEQIRDFTFVRDAVDATMAAGTRDVPIGTVLNVCGGEPVTVNAVLDSLRLLAGRPLRVRYGEGARGDVHRTGGSADLARRILGWTPLTALADGLRLQYEWQLQRRAAMEAS